MRTTDRRILSLAVPALGALIAEPLFLLTDTAMVGHLGTDVLAGLGLASAVLQTAIGLLVFLAYSTTPAVACRLGAGDRPGAIRAGLDGLWLAAGLGVLLVIAGIPSVSPLIALFGAGPGATAQGALYLMISLWGVPAMLLVIAATGLLRGLQDTRTPLLVAIIGFAANAGLNAVLIYGLELGIAGSALGTVIAQWGMAAVYLVVALRAARHEEVSAAPRREGFRTMATPSAWMLLRTATLRAALLLTMMVAASLGNIATASLHIVLTLFGLLALALDALAIAAQAMIGHDLGSADAAATTRVRTVTNRLIRLGIAGGVLLGIAVAAGAWLLPLTFSQDSAVHAVTTPMLLLLAVSLPLAGYVFVLDGVLIGAGDGRYLALAGILNLAVYAPFALLAGGPGARLGVAVSTALLWAAFSLVYLGARAITLGLRLHGDRWLVAGG